MTLNINIVELASNLAHEKLMNESFKIFEDDEETVYTEQAQDLFNELYDDYWDMIESCKEKEVETRVYVVENIDSIGVMSDILTDGLHYSHLSDEEFMNLAEQDGRVYSLEGFQDAFNEIEVDSNIDVVRFINVPLNN